MRGKSARTMLEGSRRVEPLSGSKMGGAAGVGEGAGTGATPGVGEDLVEGRYVLIICIGPDSTCCRSVARLESE